MRGTYVYSLQNSHYYPERDIGRFGAVSLFGNTGLEIPEADLLSGCVLNLPSPIHVVCEEMEGNEHRHLHPTFSSEMSTLIGIT